MSLSVLPQRDALGVQPGRLYIGGEWVDGDAGGTWTHVHSATSEQVTTIVDASASDVDRAVAAARRAFDEGPWPRMKARERKRMLAPLVDLLYAHSDELSLTQTLDNGMPMSFSGSYRVSGQFAGDLFDHYIGWIDKLGGATYPQYTDSVELQFMSFREPVGVVAAITPWNAPLLQIPNKLAPALAAGCTVVLKPSEYASLTALKLVELLAELDLPPGVVNLVTGTGATAGETLINHPGVDKITFTGSRAVGEHILSVSGKGIKRVTLELGGKSPSLVFPDADVEQAGRAVMSMISLGLSGQVCSTQTRALVHKDAYDDFLSGVHAVADSVRFGDPFNLETTSAPMINQRQLAKVMEFIERGTDEGAELLLGGDRPDGGLRQGNWVNPTVFAGVDNRMAIAREEIFGPVLAVIPFTSEAEAIAIANDSPYGLSAGVYTRDSARAFRVGKALRTGTVGVNGYSFMPNAPFGGYKSSGVGREGGFDSLEAFTEVKTMMFALGN